MLKHQGIVGADENESYLELNIGSIPVTFQGQDQIQMQQPKPQFMEEYRDTNNISKILGVSPDSISQDYPIQYVSTGNAFLIDPLTSLSVMRSIRLNISLLLDSLAEYPSQELVVVTPETIHDNSHAHVRMFAPALSVVEDPATGSAAGPIGAYLDSYNVLPDHKNGDEIILEQGHFIHRPSRLLAVCLFEDSEISNVNVRGKVKLVAKGSFYL